VNLGFPGQAARANAAVDKQKVQRALACRMGPFCLHRATEIEDATSDGERDFSLCSE
jgi:hypothetical protein